MKVLFIPISQNTKTGPIPVSIIERASCWLGCALYENGCYAETGALAMHWIAYPAARQAGPGLSSAQRSQHFGPVVFGAMPKQVTCRDTGR